MSYLFGCGTGDVSVRETMRVSNIARKHDSWFITCREPNGQYRYWFSCRNLGDPFDSKTASDVLKEVGQIKVKSKTRSAS